jgi:hypothetical protein
MHSVNCVTNKNRQLKNLNQTVSFAILAKIISNECQKDSNRMLLAITTLQIICNHSFFCCFINHLNCLDSFCNIWSIKTKQNIPAKRHMCVVCTTNKIWTFFRLVNVSLSNTKINYSHKIIIIVVGDIQMPQIAFHLLFSIFMQLQYIEYRNRVHLSFPESISSIESSLILIS